MKYTVAKLAVGLLYMIGGVLVSATWDALRAQDWAGGLFLCAVTLSMLIVASAWFDRLKASR